MLESVGSALIVAKIVNFPIHNSIRDCMSPDGNVIQLEP